MDNEALDRMTMALAGATPAGPKARGCAQEMSASDGAYARTWISSRPTVRLRSVRGGVTSSEPKSRCGRTKEVGRWQKWIMKPWTA